MEPTSTKEPVDLRRLERMALVSGLDPADLVAHCLDDRVVRHRRDERLREPIALAVLQSDVGVAVRSADFTGMITVDDLRVQLAQSVLTALSPADYAAVVACAERRAVAS